MTAGSARGGHVMSTLDYANTATDARVSYTSDAQGATVVIREPGRRLKATIEGAGGLLDSGWLPLLLFGAWVSFSLKAVWAGVLAAVALAAAAVAAVWFHKRRLDRPVVIEVTPATLVFANLTYRPVNVSLPRDEIYDIKHVAHSGQLVVRRRGKDLVEVQPIADQEELQRIAAFLRDATGLIDPRPAGICAAEQPGS